MRRSVLLLGVALLLGGAVILVLSRSTLDQSHEGTLATGAEEGMSQAPGPAGLGGSGAGTQPYRFAPTGDATIEGRVIRGGDGHPATLRLYQDAGVERWPHASGLDGLGLPNREARSRADGAFTFTGLPTGRFVLLARADDGSRGSTQVEIEARSQRIYAVLDLRAGAHVLSGRAVDTSGRPWRGLVGVYLWRDVASARTRGDFSPTGPDGGFEFTGLPAARVGLVAWQPGEFRCSSPLVQLPTKAPFTFVVSRGSTDLTGVLLDGTSSTPVAGAEILGTSCSKDGQGTLSTRTRTDAAGQFALARLRGELRLSIHAYGYAAVSARYPAGSQSLEIHLERTASISGITRSASDRTPVAGVLVHAHLEGSDRALSVTSDVDGRFQFASLAPGRWAVVAAGRKWQSADLWKTDAGDDAGYRALGAGDRTHVELLLVPPARAEGRVLDTEGQPVAGASVWVDPKGFVGLLAQVDSPWVTTDAGGHFAIDTLIPNVRNRLRARRAGAADGWTESFRPAAVEVTRIDIVLPPERWLQASVLSAQDDQPIAVAHVRASRQGEPLDERRVFGLTDETGRVLLGPLPPGELRVEVGARGFLEATEVVPAGGVGLLRRAFVLDAGHSISGRCVFPDGTPAPDMQVWATGPGRRDLASTDQTGAFSLDELVPGEWRLAIEPCLWASSLGPPEAVVIANAGARDLVLTVDAGVAKPMEITVLDPQGQPVPRFDAVGDRHFGAQHAEDGHLRLPTGHLLRWIEIRNAHTAEGTLLPLAPTILGPLDDGRTELAVRLEPGRSIHGRVVDASGGGIQGVEVTAWPKGGRPGLRIGGWHASCATNNEGGFGLVGLWAGTYRLEIQRKQPFADAPDVTCEAGTQDVRIELRPSTAARVRVVDPDGQPVYDADLQVRRVGGRWIANPHSDAQGYVVLHGIDPEGEYLLEIDPPDGRRDLGSLEVEAWSPRVESVTLPGALTIRGRIIAAPGHALGHATVRTRRMGADERYEGAAEVEDDGAFVIGHLTYGTYSVRASVEAGPAGPLVATKHVLAGTTGVELRVGPGVDLVVELEGAPASLVGAEIVLRGPPPGRELRKAPVTAERTAHFTADPHLTYTIYHWDPGAKVVVLADHVQGSAGRVGLQVVPAQSLRVHVTRPAGAARPDVQVRVAGQERPLTQTGADLYEADGLPPGTYRISIRAETRNAELHAEADACTGQTTEVVLR